MSTQIALILVIALSLILGVIMRRDLCSYLSASLLAITGLLLILCALLGGWIFSVLDAVKEAFFLELEHVVYWSIPLAYSFLLLAIFAAVCRFIKSSKR